MRNAVVRGLTPGAPRYGAIVEESWPSVEHVTNLQTLTVFDKPAGTSDETFYGHWYGHQSPMSES